MNDNFFLLINIAIGIYATYAGIVGRGFAYKNDYPEEIKADANALLRKFLLVIGPVMLVGSAVDYFSLLGDATFYFALSVIVIVLALVIVYIVIFRKRFGKYLKNK